MTSRFYAAFDEAALLPITTNLHPFSQKDVTASEQLVKSKDGRDMEELPEEAVIAAAEAIFEHSMMAGSDPATKARHWLAEAGDYREIARLALTAALPHLVRQNRSEGKASRE